MNNLENKKTFSEAEKDAIIEEILQEKPWEGIKDQFYLFLRKRLVTIFSFVISFFVIVYSFKSENYFLYIGASLPLFGYLWDTFVTVKANDLHMTDRDWVALIVKGGKVEALFKHMWIIYISMFCISYLCLYHKTYIEVYYLQFFVFSIIYSISFNNNIECNNTIFERTYNVFSWEPFSYLYKNIISSIIFNIIEKFLLIGFFAMITLLPFCVWGAAPQDYFSTAWWAGVLLLWWTSSWNYLHHRFPGALRGCRMNGFCIEKYNLQIAHD